MIRAIIIYIVLLILNLGPICALEREGDSVRINDYQTWKKYVDKNGETKYRIDIKEYVKIKGGELKLAPPSEKSKYDGLIENYLIEVMWSDLLHDWNDTFKGVDTLIVKPPYLQIIYRQGLKRYLIERIYDYSKKELVRESHYTNLSEYFNIRFKTNVSVMREFDILPFDNGYSNINTMKAEIPKDFLLYVDLKQIYSKPVLLNLKNVKVYITGNDTLRGNYQEPLRNHYFQFFIRTKKEMIAIKKWIEPKKLNLDFPSQINNPLNGKDVYFLIVDIDGNGIDELITAACGPEHHRNYFYYNIFDFTKLVKYLEKNKLLIK